MIAVEIAESSGAWVFLVGCLDSVGGGHGDEDACGMFTFMFVNSARCI